MKTNLRQLEWSDIILYFLDLKEKELSHKDIIDYFHFKYLTGVGLNRWTSPNYIRDTGSAKKLLSLYGSKLTVEYIDILFKHYKDIFNKPFIEVRWSIGLLSSEKTGWILEKIFVMWEKEKTEDTEYIISQLLSKGRANWTVEDAIKFQTLMREKGDKNGTSSKTS